MRVSSRTERVMAAVLLASVGTAIVWTAASSNSATANTPDAGATLSLAGQWRFRLDPQDVGETDKWYDQELPQEIQLPGSLQEQGFGEDVSVSTSWTGGIKDRSWFTDPKYDEYRRRGNVKIPFWLQPDKHYIGPAWYERTVTIPAVWRGKRVTLHLERCHWHTTVWADGKTIGSVDSLSTPHVYDLTYGPKTRRITVRVDNRVSVNVGPNAHSVSDHTQSNWNGIVGDIKLVATDRVWIDDVQVYPDVEKKLARVTVAVGNLTGGAGRGALLVQAESYNTAHEHRAAAMEVPFEFGSDDRAMVQFDYALGESVRTWDEFQPALYRLTVQLNAITREVRHTDTRTTNFGMRNIATKGTQFILNGRPIMLRGTLECCIFPLTGYPPTDVDSWKRIIRVCQAHGLNHMRFHSHCPPEAAFVAADELGFYFQVECGAWTSVGDGRPIDKWLYAEADRILRAYGNHPSFLLMAYGNEPGGRGRDAYLAKFVNHFKSKDPRRKYTSAAGWPILAENEYHNVPQPRIQSWGAGLRSRINALPPETVSDYRIFINQYAVPVVSHEIGQWCVYPDFDEIDKYTGVLKAKNFEIFRDSLQKNHLGDQARDFLLASGKLQTLCYKEEIESALRTPGFGGFQLLDLHDFPGQGTALVGVLDPFWDSKPYVSPAEFRRFCAATVPLARIAKRTFTTDEQLAATVEVSHYGPTDLNDAVVTWKLLGGDDRVLDSGQWESKTIQSGRLNRIGRIDSPLQSVAALRKMRLVVGIEGTEYENDWDLWVYPPHVDIDPQGDVSIADQLDDATLAKLKAGGKVLLMPKPTDINGNVAIGFSSIFWNTAWTGNQPPHTLGILCDPKHPALASFPTEYHSNWQWWQLVSRSGAMVLDEMPPDLRPIVQTIDTWFQNRRLGLIFEARVHGGKLLVCSIDLADDLATRPVARQMLHSLLNYMAGDQFNPTHELDVTQVTSLFRKPLAIERLGAKITADSQHTGFEAARAIDGDPTTIWHSPWEPQPAPMPHQLVIDLQQPTTLRGLSCLPRQDMSNGRIADFEIYVSNDVEKWGPPVVSGTWPNDSQLKTVDFDKPLTGRYVKLIARSEVNGNDFASVAEVDVLIP